MPQNPHVSETIKRSLRNAFSAARPQSSQQQYTVNFIDLTRDEHEYSEVHTPPLRSQSLTIGPRDITNGVFKLNVNENGKRKWAEGECTDSAEETPKRLSGERQKMKQHHLSTKWDSESTLINLINLEDASEQQKALLEKPRVTVSEIYDEEQHINSETPTLYESPECIQEVQETGHKSIRKKTVRPSVIDGKWRKVESALYGDIVCTVGKSVELRDGAFMRIKHVYLDDAGDYVLLGPVFTRIDHNVLIMPNKRTSMEWSSRGNTDGNAADDAMPNIYAGSTPDNPVDLTSNTSAATANSTTFVADTRFDLAPRGRRLVNELVQKVLVPEGEGKVDFGLWRRRIRDVKREVTLILTDRHDEESFIYAEGPRTEIEDQYPLTCRWRYVELRNEINTWKERSIELIPWREVENQSPITTGRYGSHNRHRSTLTPYTFVDAFCSAGGISTGAVQAGLDIKYAFDKDEKKMATYKVNFGNYNGGALTMGVYEFIEMIKTGRIRIDILHLSPPCQPYSQANSTPNQQKNEINQPPLLGCGDMIKYLRPRVVTVEQAPGIQERHKEWFDILIRQFTDLGYSVRWKEVWAFHFGVPQKRKRLIIIGSAPGEDLPHFPEPTHSDSQCSIQQTLLELEEYARRNRVSNHDPDSMQITKAQCTPRRLANTITTGGGNGNHHPGGRHYTVREFAALQSFPFDFAFGTDERKQEFTQCELKIQIGNAVPPAMAKAIFGSIIKSLRKSDKRAMNRAQAHDQAIMLEEERE